MNNIKILIISISMVLLNACTLYITEPLYTTSATIYLINETDVIVRSSESFGYEIQPGDTLIHTESYTSIYKNRPSIDNYNPFPPASILFIYGNNNSQCEYGLRRIENYENRSEISPLEFEFTFRFTEEKRANSTPCGL